VVWGVNFLFIVVFLAISREPNRKMVP